VTLQKRVVLQVMDEIDSSTLLGCDFKVTKSGSVESEQGPKTPFTHVPGSSTCAPSLDVLL